MTVRSQIHVDPMLTNISVKYMQDPANFVADRIFPIVPVTQQSARYFLYHREDWFRDDAEKRAMGTESAGGSYTLDNTPTYFCEVYAFHKDVYEQDRVNADSPLTPDEDATAFVVDKIRLNKEVNWANTFFRHGIWAQDYDGATTPTPPFIYWNNYLNSDPVSDIAKFATTMAQTTGQRPNILVLGRRVYDTLKQHPDILDRIKYTQRGVVTTELLATLFDVDQIFIANAIRNTAAKGRAAAMEFIMGNHALLLYSIPTPRLKAATAGYTFTWTGLMGANALGGRINRFAMPMLGIGTERIECELAYDMRVIAADMGCFLRNAVQ